ncbi:MAG: hypothetical protein LBQ47_06780 [Endomicrobium sp.]|jgi:hypothetical protein|nr:hypothetical protein [Endomicrobium sp.]
MINISAVKINLDDVLIRLGYSRLRTKLDEKTKTLIAETISLAQKLIKIKTIAAVETISLKENEIFFENGFQISSRGVSKLLNGCFKAYGVAITIGSALEKKRNALISSKETFEALVLDAAGSAAAEETISAVNEEIKREEAKNGCALTKRFSCGYGDWTLENQKNFLDWIGAKNIGISLNSSFLMTPEKSISALIGVKKP